MSHVKFLLSLSEERKNFVLKINAEIFNNAAVNSDRESRKNYSLLKHQKIYFI